jgi:hypothetical protein
MTDSTAPSCERHSGFQIADSREDGGRERFQITDGTFKRAAITSQIPDPKWQIPESK